MLFRSKAQDTIQDRPYGQWILGPTPCEICAPLRDQVAPLDGSFFSTYWPPLHHGCQCDVLTMTNEEVVSGGVKPSDEAPETAGLVWKFDRGDAYYIESKGGAPATEVGIADKRILDDLKLVLGAI